MTFTAPTLVALGALGVAGLACVGSFVNVVIDRLPKRLVGANEFGEEWGTNSWSHVLGGRSRCSTCGADVRPFDNVPVISWLALRGRCRSCGEGIPSFHPLVEAGVPAAVVVVGLLAVFGEGGWDSRVLPALVVLPAMVAIAVIDMRTMLVPTAIVWPSTAAAAAVMTAVSLPAGHPDWMTSAAVGAAAMAIPLALVWFLAPHAMGFGDVRLAVLCGGVVGFADAGSAVLESLMLVSITFVIASTLSLLGAALLLRVRARDAVVPFAPGLVLATLVVVAARGPLVERVFP